MDAKIVKKTQDSLGKYIKKPPLTEKLLNKPPFRFLHDVATSIINSTGFMKGLFTENEMSSENVKERDGKVAFLQKIVDIVSLVLGKTLSVRPSKVVSGLEPEKTNELLQALAEAIGKKVNNAEYVQRVLKGGDSKPSSASKKDPEKKKKDKEDDKKEEKKHRSRDDRDKSKDRASSSKDQDREKSRDKDRHKESRDKDRSKESRDKDRDKDRAKSRDKDRSRDKDKSRDKDGSRERREKSSKDKDKDDDKHKDRERRKRRELREEKTEETPVNGDAEQEPTKPNTLTFETIHTSFIHQRAKIFLGSPTMMELPPRIPRPSSAKGSRRRHGHEEEHVRDREREKSSRGRETVGEDDLPPQVANARKLQRPSSARPAPPKLKKNEGQDEPVMIGSSNVPNLITDKDDSDDDDDNFITKEEDEPQPMMTAPPSAQDEDEEGGEHGGLVKKILEKKKELEGGSQQPGRKTEIERSHVSDATRRKEREMIQKEIDKLRTSIQTLTRSVNPLGKILDFVQEDLDSMQKELIMWQKENKENSVALQREQSVTESYIEPLKAQLLELEAATSDQLDLIAAVKHNILKNDDKIEKMLSTVTKS